MSYKKNNKTKKKVHRKKKQDQQKQLQEKLKGKKRVKKFFKISWLLLSPLFREVINRFWDIFL